MLPLLVYLASPFTDEDSRVMSLRRDAVDVIGAKLCAIHRVAVFPPITVSAMYSELFPELFGTSFAFWKEIDLKVISRSDEVWVVMLDGWKESIGVQAEIKYSKRKKIPVKYIDPTTLEFIEEKDAKNNY